MKFKTNGEFHEHELSQESYAEVRRAVDVYKKAYHAIDALKLQMEEARSVFGSVLRSAEAKAFTEDGISARIVVAHEMTTFDRGLLEKLVPADVLAACQKVSQVAETVRVEVLK